MQDDLDHISFAEWLIELNACAARTGYTGHPIVQITGQLCWYSYYEEGLTQSKALDAAARDGVELGANHEDI